MNTDLLLLINGLAGHSAIVDKLMIFFASYLIYIVFAVAAACFGYLLYHREWRPVMWAAIALVVTFGLLHIAALLYVDNRPFVDYHLTQLIYHQAGKSFPSDHTTSSAAVALAVLVFTRFKGTGALLFACALIIGFARVFVGVHYPIDIAGGLGTALVGVGLVGLIQYLLNRKQANVSFDTHR